MSSKRYDIILDPNCDDILIKNAIVIEQDVESVTIQLHRKDNEHLFGSQRHHKLLDLNRSNKIHIKYKNDLCRMIISKDLSFHIDLCEDVELEESPDNLENNMSNKCDIILEYNDIKICIFSISVMCHDSKNIEIVFDENENTHLKDDHISKDLKILVKDNIVKTHNSPFTDYRRNMFIKNGYYRILNSKESLDQTIQLTVKYKYNLKQE